MPSVAQYVNLLRGLRQLHEDLQKPLIYIAKGLNILQTTALSLVEIVTGIYRVRNVEQFNRNGLYLDGIRRLGAPENVSIIKFPVVQRD